MKLLLMLFFLSHSTIKTYFPLHIIKYQTYEECLK